MTDHLPSADIIADRIFNTSGHALGSPDHMRIRRAKNVLVLDRYRLSGECLARLIQDHCVDLQIRVVDFDQAAQADVSVFMPDLVIVNTHGQTFFQTEWREWPECQTMVITEDAEAAPCGRVMTFPADGDVGLLIAAVRLTLAGGRFLAPERSRRIQ